MGVVVNVKVRGIVTRCRVQGEALAVGKPIVFIIVYLDPDCDVRYKE